MGATELTPTKIVLSGNGITPAPVAVDEVNGNCFVNTGRCFLHLLGGGVGSKTATIDSPSLCNQGGTHDILVTEGVATVHLVGPFPRSRFDDSDNKVQITYGAGANADGMKIQILELP